MKRWLRKFCDDTFSDLEENLRKALDAVALGTTQKWEHRCIGDTEVDYQLEIPNSRSLESSSAQGSTLAPTFLLSDNLNYAFILLAIAVKNIVLR